jgi:hypothetical protein
MRPLKVSVLDRCVDIECTDDALDRVVAAVCGGFRREDGAVLPHLRYRMSRLSPGAGFFIERLDAWQHRVPDLRTLVFCLERDLTLAMQYQRPDLLFLHAAALERGGKALLMVGESGSGKSMTSWGLLHRGFRYMSDELAPVDVDAMQVHPYPRALVLKQAPPSGPTLPTEGVLDVSGTYHVPVRAMPAGAASRPCAIGWLLLVTYKPGLQQPALRPIRPAEAGARIYASALNLLQHPAYGLDAVARIVEAVPCACLEAADLRLTTELIDRFAL